LFGPDQLAVKLKVTLEGLEKKTASAPTAAQATITYPRIGIPEYRREMKVKVRKKRIFSAVNARGGVDTYKQRPIMGAIVDNGEY
jgi:hypothetical protein